MGSQLPSPKGAQPPIFGPYQLRPNGCMDQDITWYLVDLGDFVLDGHPVAPSPKGGGTPKIIGPCLLWPNGWMDEADTWHGDRPQPRRVCARWGPSPLPKRGRAPSPSLRVEVENFEIGPEVGALPVIANVRMWNAEPTRGRGLQSLQSAFYCQTCFLFQFETIQTCTARSGAFNDSRSIHRSGCCCEVSTYINSVFLHKTVRTIPSELIRFLQYCSNCDFFLMPSIY